MTVSKQPSQGCGKPVPGIWQPGWREAAWQALRDCQSREPWDLVIVGGGITGAGILREASRQGLKALLVEQRDFAWGTSSRSSKMVHGGLRYLAQGDIKLTRDSVRERQRLLREAPGLVEPLNFLMPHYPHQFPGPLIFQGVLAVYDALGGQRLHDRHPASAAEMLVPGMRRDGLQALSQFTDAVTDDARLVLRVLQESLSAGGLALNYVSAAELLKHNGQVNAVRLRDSLTGDELQVRTRCVINATGAWSDRLRQQLGGAARMRPLRGSHLAVPFQRLPLAWTLSFFHPQDKRPVFAFPWEGVTLIGTTDLDHDNIDQEASITPQEVHYLLDAVNQQIPGANIGLDDIISTYAGVRPVIGSGARDPSKEKRDHAIWDEQGLITVAGGKLTTFRLIALDALRTAAPYLPQKQQPQVEPGERIFAVVDAHLLDGVDLPAEKKLRLLGRLGTAARQLVDAADPDELKPIGDSACLWAELRWSCRHESVVHLEDLLLRRSRLGLLLPRGGQQQFARIGQICREELGWDDARWQQEKADYMALWLRCYSLPPECWNPTAELLP